MDNQNPKEQQKTNEITPLEEEVTAINNPDYRDSGQENKHEFNMFEDEGIIIKKLFNYDKD